ncbi:MAG: hypothetical protein GXY07_05160 [Candidatus Hydrogenedentes bacterium]|nr:hypothetical protein [Candidatus Hydrogenedentota bacterium]
MNNQSLGVNNIRKSSLVLRGMPLDIFLIVLSCATGYFLCRIYHGSLEYPIDYASPNTMAMLGPAVYFAAGNGLGVWEPDTIPGLRDFVGGRTKSFVPSNIPFDIKVSPISTPIELTHIYYLYTIGWFWRLLGISLNTLSIYAAVWYAFSAGALYCLFRNGLGRLLSFLGVVLIISSPVFLHNSIMLRDFAKTPFILLVLCLLIRLVIHNFSNRSLLCMGALMGVLMGVGMGFRQDMLVCLPWAVAVFIVAQNKDGKYLWKTRFASIIIFLLIFIPLARPVFKGAALEGNQASVHGFFQGLSDEVEARLNFAGASYNFLVWSDSGLYAQANVFARRMGFKDPMDNPHTAEYRRVHGDSDAPFIINPGLYYTGAAYVRFQRQLMREVLLTFPADIINRAWRAVVSLYSMPAKVLQERSWLEHGLPGFFKGLYQFHHFVAIWLRYTGLLFVVATVLLICVRHFKRALLLTGMLLWFSGYPSINYEYRLTAYLLFIPYGGMLFCLERVGRWIYHTSTAGKRKRGDFPAEVSKEWPWQRRKPVVHTLALIGILLLVLLLPLATARAWQRISVQELAEKLSALEFEELDTESKRLDGRIHVMPDVRSAGLDSAVSMASGETAWLYAAAVFETKGQDIPIVIEYDQKRVFNDFTQRLTILGVDDNKNGHVTLFFPVYETTTIYDAQLFEDFLGTLKFPQWHKQVEPKIPFEEQPIWQRSRFLGISFPESYKDAFKGFYRVKDVEDLRFLPFFQVPDTISFLRDHKIGPLEKCMREYSAASPSCVN